MIQLRDLKHDPSSTPLAWLLACLLVAQVLFPIQMHTTWGVDSHGQVVQICTLSGVKTMLVDPLTGEQQVVADSDDARNPACNFSQLLSGALASAAVAVPGWLALASVQADPLPLKAPLVPVLRYSPIRAPPALV